jgi:hypothetical protein
VSHTHHTVIPVENLRVEMQLVLTREINSESSSLRPVKKMPVIAGPASRGILFRIAVRVSPFEVWITWRG